MKKIKVISCILTVALMALIFFFSSQTAEVSSKTSSGLTRKIAEFIVGITKSGDVEEIRHAIHNLIRKTAHFTLFFLLSVSVANTLFQLFGTEKLKLFIFTSVFCLVYAITDEIHQMFVPGRAGMIKDVIIDLSGAVMGAGIFLLIRYLYKRRKENDL